MFTLLVDPGHGGQDGGCSGNGLQEKDINLAVGLKLAACAKACGIQVILTRGIDMSIGLTQRASIGRFDLTVALHCDVNADPALGTLGVYCRPGPGVTLGSCLEICRTAPQALQPTPAKVHVTSQDDWTHRADNCLRFHQGPALLVEMGFLSNPKQAEFLTSEPGQMAIVQAILSGVSYNWLNHLPAHSG